MSPITRLEYNEDVVKQRGITPEEQREAYIAALRRERAGYVARGDEARAAGVDAELTRLGRSPRWRRLARYHLPPLDG